MDAQYIFVSGPAILDREIASLDPSQLPPAIFERAHARLRLWVAADKTHQHADPPHLLRLRACWEREGCCRPAEQRYDRATPNHSITSSAATSSLSGTPRPSIRAVGALMTSSNFDACTTGKSAGFAPLRMGPV